MTDPASEIETLRRRVAELEAALDDREELVDLYDNAPCGYHTIDPRGLVLRMNATELRWLGYRRDEVVGKLALTELMTPRGREIFAKNFEQVREVGVLHDAEMEMRRRDGTPLHVLVSAVATRDAAGGIVKVRATVFDDAEHHALEQRLVQANAALERGARAKQEFLASMSNEMRGPLNAVLGLSEVLEEELHGPLTDRQKTTVAHIRESGQQLLSLVNDILDVARADAGRIELCTGPVSVADLCRASLRLVHESALHKRLNVERSIAPDLPQIVVDDRRMKQVLVNLLTNAVKFTPAGGSIGIDAAHHDGGAAVRITVWDTGVGIAAEDMPRLFQPFALVEGGRHAGTGLGLSLVRRLVDLHGGTVGVESEPGRGARFTVTMPVMPLEQTAVPPTEVPPPSLGGRRLLLAEDDETNVAAMRDFLQMRGYEVQVAGNGREAIAMARAMQPDLILMDVNMPGLDGLAATREIRADASPRVSRTPIVAITALAMPGDRERCLTAGVDDYLSKPVSLKKLGATIEQQLARERG